MATKDETNTSALASFSALKPHEKRAVVLKVEGTKHEQIAAHIETQFVMNCSPRTVDGWFGPAGKLYQAYLEYNEALAKITLNEARMTIKRASARAARNLDKKIGSADERISVDASKAILNKYIPDRQQTLDGTYEEETLPEELVEAANELKEEVNDEPSDAEPQSDNDAPVGEPDSQETGE